MPKPREPSALRAENRANARVETNGALVAAANAIDSALGYLRHIRRRPISAQIAIGSGAGLVTGYTLSKTSKVAAVSVGCTIILLQFFNYRGYLKINRTQFQRDFAEFKEAVREELGMERSVLPTGKEMDDFLTKNGYLVVGFVAGSLIGYGLS